MQIWQKPVGFMAAHCYILSNGGSGCVVVDPGQHSLRFIDDTCAENGLTPVAALVTHGHADHHADAAAVSSRHGIPVYVHPADRADLSGRKTENTRDNSLPLLLSEDEPRAVEALVDGAVLALAGMRIQVRWTPGHTPGSVMFETCGALFTGDTLVAGGIGRVRRGRPHSQLMHSLALLADLPDATEVYCGHGPNTTMGDERRVNPYVRASLSPGLRRPTAG